MGLREAGSARVRRAAVVLMAIVLRPDAVLEAATRSGGTGMTRADLDAARRTVNRLEADYALASTRQPYLVLDLEARVLRYRLMGMTVREVPLGEARVRGLQASPAGGDARPGRVAGIFTLQEKSDDPRLKPLTPAQIEAGLDDENAADALPPDPPARFALGFRQPIRVRIEAGPDRKGVGGAVSTIAGGLARLLGRAPAGGSGQSALALDLLVEEATAREIYRSLIPGLRFLIVPPPGLSLPEAGQEAPRAIRPSRPSPRPTPPPKAPPGVPFQIPPSVPTDAGAPQENALPAPAPVPGSEEAPVPALRVPEGEPAPAAGAEQTGPAVPDPAATPEPDPGSR